jgi:hypothetical protein
MMMEWERKGYHQPDTRRERMRLEKQGYGETGRVGCFHSFRVPFSPLIGSLGTCQQEGSSWFRFLVFLVRAPISVYVYFPLIHHHVGERESERCTTVDNTC